MSRNHGKQMALARNGQLTHPTYFSGGMTREFVVGCWLLVFFNKQPTNN
ncbi:MAG TPA: hypothetical protein V6D48_02945 [Oculatellaceae cyanobacterium]